MMHLSIGLQTEGAVAEKEKASLQGSITIQYLGIVFPKFYNNYVSCPRNYAQTKSIRHNQHPTKRGKIVSIEFTRQEPKKRHLSDAGLALNLLAQDELWKGRANRGHPPGRLEGTQKTVIAMVRNAAKNGLSQEMIAQIANLDITLVRKILNNEPVEIPLHLLPDS